MVQNYSFQNIRHLFKPPWRSSMRILLLFRVHSYLRKEDKREVRGYFLLSYHEESEIQRKISVAAVLQIAQSPSYMLGDGVICSCTDSKHHHFLLLQANCRHQRHRFPTVCCAKSRKFLRGSDYVNKQLFVFSMLVLAIRNLILLWNDCAAIQQKCNQSQQRAALHNLELKLQCSTTEHQCYSPWWWHVRSWTFSRYFPLISGELGF